MFEPHYCGLRVVGASGGSLGPLHCRVQDFPQGVGAARGGSGLKEVLLASMAVFGVYVWGVGLG